MSQTNSTHQHLQTTQLTFTRFVAAIIVVIFHYGLDIFPFSSSVISFIFKQGNLFVSYFFVLSGFVMYFAYHNQKINYFTYLRRRIARIYPIHLVGIFLLLWAYLLTDRITPPFDILFQASLLHIWLPKFSLIFNYPSWSLGVEMFFYTTFPFTLMVFKKIGHQNRIVATYLIWLFSIVSGFLIYITLDNHFAHAIVKYNPVMRLSEFIMGLLCASIFIKLKIKKTKNWHLLLITIFIIFLIKFSLPFSNLKHLFLAPFFSLFIILFSSSATSVGRWSKLKGLILLGEISYAIYILQVPIYNLSYYAFKRYGLTNPTTSFYLYLCILILTSYLSYYFIEMPAKRMINKIQISFK